MTEGRVYILDGCREGGKLQFDMERQFALIRSVGTVLLRRRLISTTEVYILRYIKAT